MTLIKELLPAPLGPMTARISPLFTDRSTSDRRFDAAEGEADAFQRQHLLAGSRQCWCGRCLVERDHVRIDRGVVTLRCHGRSRFQQSRHRRSMGAQSPRDLLAFSSLSHVCNWLFAVPFPSHVRILLFGFHSLRRLFPSLSDYCCVSFPTAREFLMALSEMIGSLRCTSSPTLSISASTE